MSAEKCGKPYGYVLSAPKVVDDDTHYDPELCWTKKTKALLKKILAKEPGYKPFSIKALYGKAYRLGLLEEE